MATSARERTRAAVYCRVSTTGQEDGTSLLTQEGECRRHAAEQGWEVVAVYRDVHSGDDLFERHELGLLRESVRRREIDVVVAHGLDRLTRNQPHLGLILSEADYAGVVVELVTERLEDTPEGHLLQAVRGYVAEVERLKIRERTQRGLRARVAAGKPLVGWKSPYGLAWEDASKSKLVEDPETGHVVRRIFREAETGRSLRGIALALAADGIPSPTGNAHWSINSIRKMLNNPVYAGAPRAYRTRCDKVRGRGTVFSPRVEEEQVALPAGVAPTLISPATREAVQARLERNKTEATRRNLSPEATLLRAGFARCGNCGRALHAARHDGGRLYLYRCGRERGCRDFSISAQVLDPPV